MEKRQQLKQAVQKYFEQNGINYISNFEELSNENKEHIVNIGTSIIATRDNLGPSGGSFVKSIVNNNLKSAILCADSINKNAIQFYIMLMENLTY